MILLKEKVNLEYFAEVHKPKDPIQEIVQSSKSVNEINTRINEHLEALSNRYKGYVDFIYKFNYTNGNNGCYSAWFDLYGIKEK